VKFTILFITFLSISVSAKSTCYKVRFKDKTKASYTFLTAIPSKNSQETFTKLVSKSGSEDSQYFCMKKKSSYICDGDDDSGKYEILKSHLLIHHLTFGETDKEVTEVRFKKPLKVKFSKVNCN